MKKTMALMLALLLALSLAACGEGNEGGNQTTTAGKVSDDTTAAANDTTAAGEDTTAAQTPAADVYGFTLSDVKLVPGQVFDSAKLPAADSVFEMTSCAFEGTDKMYNYGTVEVTAADDGKNEIVYSVSILDPNTPTDEGLYLGDALSVVTKLYGEDYAENGTEITYQKGDALLILIMQNGYVASIEYRLDI